MADRAASLEIGEDRAFQERYWRAQRIGWIVFALIVVAALAGLTGKSGPFARATISTADGVIDYPRVTRWETDDDLRITLPPDAPSEIQVEVSSAFARIFALEDVEPAPVRSFATGGGYRFVFASAPPVGERSIIMHVRTLRPSSGEGMYIRINDGPPLKFAPIVLP